MEKASQKVTFDRSRKSKDRYFRVLTQRIEAYFDTHRVSKKANWLFVVKNVAYFLITLALYLAILSGEFYGWRLGVLFVLFGVFLTILLFSVAHDASHNAISKSRWVNGLFAYVWNVAGISSYFWALKHNVAHHGFTNIPGKDDDIDQSKLVRLNPNAKRRWFHRYQHLYAPFLYTLLSLNIIYVKDFKLLMQHNFGNKTIPRHPTLEIWILLATKLFFIGYMIVIPKILLGISWGEILGYHVMMHLAIGLFIGLVLVPVHVTGESSYRLPDKEGKVHCDWREQQMEATVDFAAKSRLVNWITGGLNTHVAHHLYPSVNHIHYFQLTRIIGQTAKEFGVPYRNYSLARVYREHLHFLKMLGSKDNPNPDREFGLVEEVQ
jgi:linoleoyl-CoA desaturase